MLEELDEQVSTFAESMARTLSRRRVMVTSVKGIVAAVAGIALGTFGIVRVAFGVNPSDRTTEQSYLSRKHAVD